MILLSRVDEWNRNWCVHGVLEKHGVGRLGVGEEGSG